MSQYKNHSFVRAFSGNLRALRGDSAQADFAKKIGVSNQVTYHRYEHGRVPRPETLSKLAYRFGITVDELLSPLPADRLNEIRVRLGDPAPDPEAQPYSDEHKAHLETAVKTWELISPEAIQAVHIAMKLDTLSWEELGQACEHFSKAGVKAPVAIRRYYAVINRAFDDEVDRRLLRKRRDG